MNYSIISFKFEGKFDKSLKIYQRSFFQSKPFSLKRFSLIVLFCYIFTKGIYKKYLQIQCVQILNSL